MMVYPPIATESSSRSSLDQPTQLSLFQSQSPVPSLLLPHHQHHHHHHQQHHHHHQPSQQQQQILYTPYNTIPTCIPPNNQAQCIYSNQRKNPPNSITLRNQESFRGVKNSKWKSRSLRVKEHQSNPNLQHPVSYPPPPPPPPPPPLILFDPIQNYLSTTPVAPITSLYVNQSSTLLNHGGVYSNENYTNFNSNIITQPYYKPPELKTYCLIDRPSSQNTFTHQQTIPSPPAYYNATSSNNLNHQNIKSFIASAASIYPNSVNDHRIIPNAAGPTQIFPSSLTSHGLTLTNYLNDKVVTNSPTVNTEDLSMIKCQERIFSDRDDGIIPDNDRLFTVNADINNQKVSKMNIDDTCIKSQFDNKFAGESSNFDFTIEAEKMVSALCNTTSCELDKDEDDRCAIKIIKKELSSLKKDDNNDAADKLHEDIDKSYKPWFFNNFFNEINLSGDSVGTQTVDTFIDKSQYPELVRKTIYLGCDEADKLLKNSPTVSSKQSWLRNLSSATKMALNKSSTCFPIFSGDKIFMQDLISALLRVGNGWLILDHYLNKQHHPNLNDKYDNNLIESFKKWEGSTNDLLENVIKTFIKLETTNLDTSGFFNDKNISDDTTNMNSSFPGDVSLYVNYGLFGDPPALNVPVPSTPQSKSATTSNRKPPYISNESRGHRNRWSTGKDSKLRTKWTITEHSRGSNEIPKKINDENINWNSVSEDSSITQIPQLTNTIEPRKKLYCSFFLSQNNENSNNSKLPTNVDSILNTEKFSIDRSCKFWNPCIASNPLCNFTYNNASLNNSSNKMTSKNQRETGKTDSNNGNTINLSAWFASMRNKRSSNVENSSSTWLTTAPLNNPIKFCESRSPDTSTSLMDTNHQLRTLKNMRTIQCAPWTANNLTDDCQDSKCYLEEYDSSEDVRVYMKPGSYNVPKKRNQSRRSQRREASALRNNRKNSQNLLNNEETSCPSNSLVVSRSNISSLSPSSSTSSQHIQNKDATWKAACASAGHLLDSLKVRKNSQCIESDKIVNSTPKSSEHTEKYWKKFSDYGKIEHKINFEVSNNSETVKESSTNTQSIFPHDHPKSNIKTDSWLIRTLNNVTNDTNKDCKQVKTKPDNEMNVLPWRKSSDSDKKSEKHSFSLETSHTISVMTLVDVVGKATYSETVRRFSSTAKPASSSGTKMTQQKNEEYGKMANNLLCTIDESKNEEQDESMKLDNSKIKPSKMIKLKKNKNSNDDRDWSIWYNSKRKQHCNSLGQVILDKLESIYRTLSRMDITRVLKCPMSNVKLTGVDNWSTTESINIEHYRKMAKDPMSLETIGCKLKNHEYRKVEHVIRDFRKIIHNSKLYHKNDKDCTEKIDNLSKKLEELLQQNFADGLVLHRRNCSPIQNQISMSNNNAIINSSSPRTQELL